jgi:hypothetical protein
MQDNIARNVTISPDLDPPFTAEKMVGSDAYVITYYEIFRLKNFSGPFKPNILS